MAINIYTVANHLEENGWQLLSTEYKNLKTPLKMKCPEGHEVEDTYEHWRKHMLCDKCIASDDYAVKKNKVPIKKIDTHRILALDAATNITGFSIYDNDVLVSYGIHKIDSSLDTTERINKVKHWLTTAIKEWQPDFVGIEHIQLQTFGAKNSPQVEMYRVLANLQGVLLDLLFEKGIECGLVYSSAWRKYCGIDGSGRENKKKAAQDKVQMWYGLKCTQDEADAICIGKYFSKNLNKPKSSWGEDI
jgi:Holliday junction resolvasome RuvABC endonuclease subunit